MLPCCEFYNIHISMMSWCLWSWQTTRAIINVSLTIYPTQTKILEGRTNISECVSWGSTFQGCVAQMKSASKTYSERLVQPSKFTPPKRRPCSQTKILEGWTTDEMRMFETLFLLLVAHMKYSHPWKVLRKSAFHLLFTLPKSSFGMGKILRLGSMQFLRFTRGW
jgi:hypothetical protein